jgi:twitching motility protein PilT
MLGSHAVSNIIREGKIEKITSVLQSAKREGMQSMDDALEELVLNGVIDGRDAYMKAAEKRRFETYVPS